MTAEARIVTTPRSAALPACVDEQAILSTWLDHQLLAALLRDGLAGLLESDAAQSPFELPGLSISAHAVLGLLGSAEDVGKPERLMSILHAAWRELLGLRGGVFARLAGLGLDGTALRILALCAAPDVDGRYPKVFGFIHDDVTRRHASKTLLRKVLKDRGEDVDAALVAGAPLRSLNLIRAIEGEAASALTSIAASPVVICALAQDIPVDIVPLIRLTSWPMFGPAPREPCLEARAKAFAALSGRSLVVHVIGARSSERRQWAEAMAVALDERPLRIELPPQVPDLSTASALGSQLGMLATLRTALPIIDLPPAWHAPDALSTTAVLFETLTTLPRSILVLSPSDQDLQLPQNVTRRVVQLEPLSAHARSETWRQVLACHGIEVDEAGLAALAPLRLEASEIIQAAADAVAKSWPDEKPSTEALLVAGRHLTEAAAPRFARCFPPTIGLDRVVLPADRSAQLREIVAQVRHGATVQESWGFRDLLLYGCGVTALFAGPSGTGKTLSARAIAGELTVDLMQVDLAQVISKYIGETEKNLASVFAAAESSGAALLFDEADALFGKRSEVKDAHDRYANIETAFMLQRLETFSGLAILTTNLRPNLDTAFLRRLRFVVDFPRPDAAMRAALWRRAFPERAPLDPDLDLEMLAEGLELTGGSIQNAALRAAYLAASDSSPIGLRHVVYACRRELLKLGQLSAERDLAVLAASMSGGGS
jgi:hypothetical protein